MRIIVAVACSLLIAPASANDADTEEEIILWHARVDWGNSPAYFVSAPKQMRADFADAIADLIAIEPEFCDPTYGTMWVCESNDYIFFRAISGEDRKTKDGMACSKTHEIPIQKNYSGRMLAKHAECLELIWHDDDQEYAVYAADENF